MVSPFVLSYFLSLPANYTTAMNSLEKGVMEYSGITNKIKTIETYVKENHKVIANTLIVSYSLYRVQNNKNVQFKWRATDTTSIGFYGGKTQAFASFTFSY